jgi:hypothetical protein
MWNARTLQFLALEATWKTLAQQGWFDVSHNGQ